MDTDQSHRPRPAGARADPGLARHRRRAARRTAGGLRPGGAPLCRHPPRGRDPGRVGARPVRRLPAGPRAAGAAADVQPDRGARSGHGRARRPPRRGRCRRPGRVGPRKDRAGAALAGRGPGRGRVAGRRRRSPTGRRHDPTRPPRPRWSRGGRASTACGSATAPRPGPSGPRRSTRGRSWSATAGGTCSAARTPPPRLAPTASTGSAASTSWTSRSILRTTSTRWRSRGEPRLGWEFADRRPHRGAVREAALAPPRARPARERSSDQTSRDARLHQQPLLVRRAAGQAPAPFRVDGGPELRACVHQLAGGCLRRRRTELPRTGHGRALESSDR